MKRPDAMMLKRILGKNLLGDEDGGRIVKRALEVPLLDFTSKEDARDFDWALSDRELSSKDEVVDVPEWIFDEFVFVYRRPINLNMGDFAQYASGWYPNHSFQDGMLVETKNATVWTYINRNVQDSNLMKMMNYPKNVLKGMDELRVDRGLKYPITDMYYMTQFVSYQGEKHVYRWDGWYGLSSGPLMAEDDVDGLWVATEGTEEFWGNDLDGLTQHATYTYGGIVRLMTYLKYGDKHLVEVLPAESNARTKSQFSRKRPWLNATGPRMLLLDRMPATQRRDHQGGTHASPKPHRRRGHWKVLRHPKYRHHPQYGKQIYIKPSFVGPKQVTHEGNIYRVVEPLEETISP